MTQRPPMIIRAAMAADRPLVAGMMAQAFFDDPAMAFLFPDAAGRGPRLARFFTLMARIDTTPENWVLAGQPGAIPVAAALWRPPGTWETPAWTIIANLLPLLGAFGTALPRALALQSALQAHHPQAPHWYLQFVGCTPVAQGRGFGGAAIRDRLLRCDAEGLPAALETATPGNLPIYQAMGFRITGEFVVKGGGPTFWTMWREPGG